MKRLLVAGRIRPGSPDVWELRLRMPRNEASRQPLARAEGGDLAAARSPTQALVLPFPPRMSASR